MAEQANRMVIGGFVVIAVFLLAASIVIFGSGKFFKKTDEYVLHFEGSIKGLNVGAPVLFQGVQIGSVTSIALRADREKMTLDIPVIIHRIFPAMGGDGHRGVLSHHPADYIHIMHPPVPHLGGVVAPPAELVRCDIVLVLPVCTGTQPHVPV